MERKAALRKRRTRNRKYTSEEFTSVFSQHKNLNQSYTGSVPDTDIVTFDGALEVVEMTVDQVLYIKLLIVTRKIMLNIITISTYIQFLFGKGGLNNA